MMADLVGPVAAVLAAQGLDVDVLNGAEHAADELFAQDPSGDPKPRVVFIENGLDGRVKDTFGPAVGPGASISRTARVGMVRAQGCEVRVWGFDLTRNDRGDLTAGPIQHRAAVNRLLHHVDGTGVLPALCQCIGEAKETWTLEPGAFDTDARDIKFGALYVFTFVLQVPIIVQTVTVATPAPAPKTTLSTDGGRSASVGCGG